MKKKIDRIGILKKYAGSKKEPSMKELKEAYGYLDYCNYCGKSITFWDRISFNVEHSISGNGHRRNCKKENHIK